MASEPPDSTPPHEAAPKAASASAKRQTPLPFPPAGHPPFAAFEHFPELIFVVDEAGEAIHLNRAARQHAQEWSLAQKTGASENAFVQELRRSGSIATPRGRKSYRVEPFALPVEPGASELTAFRAYPLELIDEIKGKFLESQEQASQLNDLLKSTLRKLIAKTDEAETADRAKSEFLSVVSHELRTPMNAIVGFGQLLLDEQLAPAQEELVESVIAQADKLLHILDDLLVYVESESGHARSERALFRPGELIDEAVASLAELRRQREVTLRVDLAQSLPDCLEGDREALTRVLRHLLSNAVKFSPRGTVSIRAHLEPADDKRPKLLIEITDSGIGISRDELETLFLPFRQADSTSTRRFEGLGLGLAVCRALVRRMGGEIDVTSAPRRGSTFRVRIPVRPSPRKLPAPLPRDVSNQPAASDTLRIAIALDDKQISSVLQSTLGSAGHELVTASSPEAFEQHLRQARFDALIIDVDLPGLHLARLVENIRRGGFGAQIAEAPILGLASSPLHQRRIALLFPGINDLIIKPIAIPCLLSSLRRLSPALRQLPSPAA